MFSRSSRYVPNDTPCGRTRREFLWEVAGGFAGLALIDLLARDGFFTPPARAADPALAPSPYPLALKAPHFPAKANRAVFLFMNGGPSHIDTFDHKPALAKFNGTSYQGDVSVGSNGRP